MTISEFTVQSVRKYLRTVLFVDDQLFPPSPTQTSELQSADLSAVQSIPDTVTQEGHSENIGDQSSDQSAGNGMTSAEPIDSQTPNDESYSPQVVVEGFAKQGIVCGLYQPNTVDFSGGTVPKTMVDLCDNADVFILDWRLKNDELKSPVPDLLAQLLRNDEAVGTPKPIRFCAIYTDRPLNAVVLDLNNDIIRVLAPESVVQDDSVRRFQLRGLTIRLYSKNKQQESPGVNSCFVSSYDLAERVIHDFASEFEGVMPANALCGIARVRANSKRILEKFPPALDYALMVHGGLTVKAPTTSEDLQELLSDEIQSILSEPSLSDNELYGMFHEKADKISPEKFKNIFPPVILKNGGVAPEDIKAYFCNIFKKNDTSMPSPFIGCNSQATTDDETPSIAFLNRLLRLVKKVDESRMYSEGDLSQLYCYRTIYGNTRVLRTGTIVHEIGTQRRYVCLMPSCDCIRLGQDVVEFPFWELTPVDANHKGHAHGVVITDESGRSKTICVKGKIHKKMRFWKFRANNEVNFSLQGDKYILSEETTAEVKTQFEWVAELKPLHAQRMAEYVSRQFSRVGLAESEWLRLQVDR